MELILTRNAHTSFGTFGVMTVGDHKLYTVEQDWEDNKRNVSCIPNGTYALEYYHSPRHGNSFIISNVELNIGKFPGEARRDVCLIHKANLASQLQGCIAPGLSLGLYKGQWSVQNSTAAFKKIMSALGTAGVHTLAIKSDFPTFKE